MIELGWEEHVGITVYFSVIASIQVQCLFCGIISIQRQLERSNGLVGMI